MCVALRAPASAVLSECVTLALRAGLKGRRLAKSEMETRKSKLENQNSKQPRSPRLVVKGRRSQVWQRKDLREGVFRSVASYDKINILSRRI